MTFPEYIAGRRIGRNPAGDFVRDARADDTLPDCQTWRELEAYLSHCNACDEAVDAGRIVWRGYIKALSRAR